MGHKEKFSGADEYDAFTGWRKYLCYLARAGAVKKIKRRFNKRVRKQEKERLLMLMKERGD